MNESSAERDVLVAMLGKAGTMRDSAQRNLTAGSYGDASSRAYYAALHAISAVLASRGLTYTSHSQTIGGFNREFVKGGEFPPETTRRLQRLFEDRQIADYDWTFQIERETAERDVADASWILARCCSVLNLDV